METTFANNPEPVIEQETELATDATVPEPVLDAEPQDENLELTAEEELEEIERNGKRYKLPKDIIPELMRQDDYTRKTQEVAETRKQIAAEREAFQWEVRAREELSTDMMNLKRVTDDLKELQEINFSQLQPEQQLQYLNHQNQLVQAKAAYEGLIGQKKEEFYIREQQQTLATLQRAVEDLRKPDPENGWTGGFDKVRSDELTQFCVNELGIPLKSVQTKFNEPALVKMANLAKIGKAYLAQKKTAPAPRPQAEVSAKVPTARAAVTPPVGRMSVNQMSAHLKKAGVI